MTLQAGWLRRQLDRVADDVDKWPEWMKREAEFSSPIATSHEQQAEPVRTLTAGGEDTL
jgi:hypothetical protein